MYTIKAILKTTCLILVLACIACTEKPESTEKPTDKEIEAAIERLKEETNEEIDVEKFRAMMENPPKVIETAPTPESKKYDKIEEQIKEGNTFPAFELEDSENNLVSDKDFNKGYVFYSFWGTWCSSCIDNIVAVRDARKKGEFKDVKFVSVSVDGKKENWDQYIYQYDMNDYMTNVLIGRDREHVLSNFLYKKMQSVNDNNEATLEYHYLTPSYCLVKDGVIVSNHPMLPKYGDAFLEQLK